MSEQCPDCGDLPGLYLQGRCPSCYVKQQTLSAPKPSTILIDEILEELGEAYHNNYPDQKAHKTAKAQLKQAILDSLPPEREVTTEKTFEGYDRTNPRHRYTTGVDVGYKTALTQVRNSIEELFGRTE